MSIKRKEFTKEEFFEAKQDELKIDQPLSFDCFIHLEENQKIIHWIRQGAIFTTARKEKLLKLGNPPIMIMNAQKLQYLEYLGVREGGPIVEETPSEQETQRDHHGQVSVKTEVPVFGRVMIKEEETATGKAIIAGDSATAAGDPPPVKAGTAKVRVDADFLNAVIKSTVEVFEHRFRTPIKFKPPKPRTGNANTLPIDIASFIALTSETIRGTIGLCFPSETYRYLLSQATGMAYTHLSPEVCLGSGEFIAFIYQTVRPRLFELGYEIDKAIPTLIVGKSLSLPHIIPDKGFSITFESPGGLFSFEIGIKTGG